MDSTKLAGSVLPPYVHSCYFSAFLLNHSFLRWIVMYLFTCPAVDLSFNHKGILSRARIIVVQVIQLLSVMSYTTHTSFYGSISNEHMTWNSSLVF